MMYRGKRITKKKISPMPMIKMLPEKPASSKSCDKDSVSGKLNIKLSSTSVLNRSNAQAFRIST